MSRKKTALSSSFGGKIRQWLGLALIVGAFFFAMMLQSGREHKEPLSVPTLAAQVIDQTGTLKQPELQQLQAKLAAFERDKGSQIVILMVGSTQAEDIAAYANRVADAWKIGRRDIGDGILVVVAKDDRRMRIEVARALEGALPDIEAARIIEHDMKPHFKAGDFGKGLSAAADSIIAKVAAESLPEHNKVQQNQATASAPQAASSSTSSAAVSSAASGSAVAKNNAQQTSESANNLFTMAMAVAGVAAAIAIRRQSRDKKWSFLLLLPIASGLIALLGMWILPKEEIGEIGTAISMYALLYPVWKWFIKYVFNLFSGFGRTGSTSDSSSSDDDNSSSGGSSGSGGGYTSGGGGSYGGGGASGNW